MWLFQRITILKDGQVLAGGTDGTSGFSILSHDALLQDPVPDPILFQDVSDILVVHLFDTLDNHVILVVLDELEKLLDGDLLWRIHLCQRDANLFENVAQGSLIHNQWNLSRSKRLPKIWSVMTTISYLGGVTESVEDAKEAEQDESTIQLVALELIKVKLDQVPDHLLHLQLQEELVRVMGPEDAAEKLGKALHIDLNIVKELLEQPEALALLHLGLVQMAKDDGAKVFDDVKVLVLGLVGQQVADGCISATLHDWRRWNEIWMARPESFVAKLH